MNVKLLIESEESVLSVKEKVLSDSFLEERDYKKGQVFKRGTERLKIQNKVGKGYRVTIWGPDTPSKTLVLSPKDFGKVTLMSESFLRKDIPKELDSFLQDISQQTEIISYGDILNKFKASSKNVKELEKLRKETLSSVNKTGEISISILKRIKNLVKGK